MSGRDLGAVEADLADALAGALAGGGEAVAERAHGENAATGGDDVAAAEAPRPPAADAKAVPA